MFWHCFTLFLYWGPFEINKKNVDLFVCLSMSYFEGKCHYWCCQVEWLTCVCMFTHLQTVFLPTLWPLLSGIGSSPSPGFEHLGLKPFCWLQKEHSVNNWLVPAFRFGGNGFDFSILRYGGCWRFHVSNWRQHVGFESQVLKLCSLSLSICPPGHLIPYQPASV